MKILLTILLTLLSINASAYERDLGRKNAKPLYNERGESRYDNIYGSGNYNNNCNYQNCRNY